VPVHREAIEHFVQDDWERGQRVDVRARLAVVAVGAETIGAQGVDQDEEQIEVVTPRQRGDLVGAAQRPRVRTDLQL
jgi:hypothetical protein